MRSKSICTACKEPLGESRLTVHDARSDGLTGQFHVSGCLEAWALLVETERNAHRFVGSGQ